MFVRECLILGNGLKYNVTKSLKSMPHFGSLPSPLGVKVKIRLRGVLGRSQAISQDEPQGGLSSFELPGVRGVVRALKKFRDVAPGLSWAVRGQFDPVEGRLGAANWVLGTSAAIKPGMVFRPPLAVRYVVAQPPLLV